MKKEIVAIVPIRKGSQRIKNKNFRAFGDKNLLEIKLNSLKKVKLIDKIVVSTDSDLAIKIAKKNGVSYHVREKFYASSKCSNSQFFEKKVIAITLSRWTKKAACEKKTAPHQKELE